MVLRPRGRGRVGRRRHLLKGHSVFWVALLVVCGLNRTELRQSLTAFLFGARRILYVVRRPEYWGVGQLADRRTVNPEVAGSSPAAPAFDIRATQFVLGGLFLLPDQLS